MRRAIWSCGFSHVGNHRKARESEQPGLTT
jgi:hypothetical protein